MPVPPVPHVMLQHSHVWQPEVEAPPLYYCLGCQAHGRRDPAGVIVVLTERQLGQILRTAKPVNPRWAERRAGLEPSGDYDNEVRLPRPLLRGGALEVESQ